MGWSWKLLESWADGGFLLTQAAKILLLVPSIRWSEIFNMTGWRIRNIFAIGREKKKKAALTADLLWICQILPFNSCYFLSSLLFLPLCIPHVKRSEGVTSTYDLKTTRYRHSVLTLKELSGGFNRSPLLLLMSWSQFVSLHGYFPKSPARTPRICFHLR